MFANFQVLVIVPTLDDHGRKVVCRAGIKDGDDQSLFEVVSEEATLSVVSAPTPTANETAKGQEGGEVDVSFVFRANPKPTSAKWIVSEMPEKEKKKEGGDDTEKKEGEGDDDNKKDEEDPEDRQENSEDQEKKDGGEQKEEKKPKAVIQAGESGDKYEASEISDEGELKYRVSLKIKQLAAEDAPLVYRAEVENEKGMTPYYFKLQVTENPDDGGGGENGGENGGEDGEDGEEGEKGKSNATAIVFVVLAVICVIGLALGGAFVYKKKKANTETAPLRN